MEKSTIPELSLQEKEQRLKSFQDQLPYTAKLEEFLLSSCHEAMASAEKTFHTFQQIANDLEEEYRKIFPKHPRD